MTPVRTTLWLASLCAALIACGDKPETDTATTTGSTATSSVATTITTSSTTQTTPGTTTTTTKGTTTPTGTSSTPTTTDTGTLVPSVDADKDGVPAEEDCDDKDSRLGARDADQDCDGALTDEDCDDLDPTSTLVAEDADCDGVLTKEDCDDSDPALASPESCQIDVRWRLDNGPVTVRGDSVLGRGEEALVYSQLGTCGSLVLFYCGQTEDGELYTRLFDDPCIERDGAYVTEGCSLVDHYEDGSTLECCLN